MDDHELAVRVAELVGGPGNVRSLHTCTTRLRFVLFDQGLLRRTELEQTSGVAHVVVSGGQAQVVVGTNVDLVHRELLRLPGWSTIGAPATAGGEEGGGAARVGKLRRILDVIPGTFVPLLPAIVGASMIKMLFAVASQLGWYQASTPSPTALVLLAAANAIFYFLPVFVAITSARELGASPYISGAIAAALLEPNFLALGQPGDVAYFLGVPLYVFSYANSVLPAMLISWALAALERSLRRWVHPNMQLIVVPLVSLLLLVPLAALVFGPIGVLVGNAIASAIAWLAGLSPVLLGIVIGGGAMFLVIMGLHVALLPVVLVNINQLGADPVIAAVGAYNFAVWGLAVGAFIRARQEPELRAVTGPAAIAGLLAGISEPMLYGVILRFRRVIPMVVIAGAVGGAIIGLFRVGGTALGPSSIFTIPLMQPTLGYIVGIGASFLLAMTAVMIMGYRRPQPEAIAPTNVEASTAGTLAESTTRDARRSESTRPAVPAAASTGPLEITSPLTGTVIPLSEVPDPVFAGSMVGPGVAIMPTVGRVIAPAAGTIIMAPPSGHVVGIRTAKGAELLIHVGIDTVELAGGGFTLHTAPGDTVTAGDVLIEFDLDTVTAAGYSLATPVVITNPSLFGAIRPTTEPTVTPETVLLTLTPATGATP